MKEKTFILCLGHQKCATSWLYNYLRLNDNFNEGCQKEYHVWDYIDSITIKEQLKKIKSNKKNLFLNKIYHLFQTSINFKKIVKGVKYFYFKKKIKKNIFYYFDYFESLYYRKYNLTADLTPSYSVLEIPRLKMIQEEFKKRNITTKVIIFIRDPVSRIKSVTKMNLYRNQNFLKKNEEEKKKMYRDLLRKKYNSTEYLARGNYKKTIENAEKVFSKKNIYFGIYENLFNSSEIRKLSNFIGIDVNTNFKITKVNEGKFLYDTDELDNKIKKKYATIYKFCTNKFPILKVLWK